MNGLIHNSMQAATYQVSIFIAGDLQQIKQVCREYCMTGLCVTVTPTDYIYTGGEESGAIIGLINYPRFDKVPVDINADALALGQALLKRCCQKSFSIMTPTTTTYYYLEGVK